MKYSFDEDVIQNVVLLLYIILQHLRNDGIIVLLDSSRDTFIISPEEVEEVEEVEKSVSSLKDIGGRGSVLSGYELWK